MPGVLVERAFELIDAAEIGEGGAGCGVGLVEAGDGLREIAVGIARLSGSKRLKPTSGMAGTPASRGSW